MSAKVARIYIFFLNANGTVKTFQKIASGVGGGPTLMPNDFFGTELASPGDMDGNGANDLLASSQDARGGAVYLLLLNADGTTKSSQMIASGIGGAPTLPPGEFFGSN